MGKDKVIIICDGKDNEIDTTVKINKSRQCVPGEEMRWSWPSNCSAARVKCPLNF